MRQFITRSFCPRPTAQGVLGVGGYLLDIIQAISCTFDEYTKTAHIVPSLAFRHSQSFYLMRAFCPSLNCHITRNSKHFCRSYGATQIIALAASYFVAVTALDVVTNVGTIDDLTSTARIVLVLPVAILDAVFILWVFTSLSKTLAQLQARRAGSKLELYRCVWSTVVGLRKASWPIL